MDDRRNYKRVYNLKVKLYSYQDKEGKEHGRYLEIGGVIQDESDGHLFMYLEPYINLAGLPRNEKRGNIAVNMFPAEENAPANNNNNNTNADNDNAVTTNIDANTGLPDLSEWTDEQDEQQGGSIPF